MKVILVVEDCLEYQQQITNCLNGHYQVFLKNTADQILEYTLKLKPDLIILDINLPVKNGYFAITELKKFLYFF